MLFRQLAMDCTTKSSSVTAPAGSLKSNSLAIDSWINRKLKDCNNTRLNQKKYHNCRDQSKSGWMSWCFPIYNSKSKALMEDFCVNDLKPQKIHKSPSTPATEENQLAKYPCSTTSDNFQFDSSLISWVNGATKACSPFKKSLPYFSTDSESLEFSLHDSDSNRTQKENHFLTEDDGYLDTSSETSTWSYGNRKVVKNKDLGLDGPCCKYYRRCESLGRQLLQFCNDEDLVMAEVIMKWANGCRGTISYCPDTGPKDTPLHIAIRRQNVKLVDLLLQYGFAVNFGALNSDDATPLCLACSISTIPVRIVEHILPFSEQYLQLPDRFLQWNWHLSRKPLEHVRELGRLDLEKLLLECIKINGSTRSIRKYHGLLETNL